MASSIFNKVAKLAFAGGLVALGASACGPLNDNNDETLPDAQTFEEVLGIIATHSVTNPDAAQLAIDAIKDMVSQVAPNGRSVSEAELERIVGSYNGRNFDEVIRLIARYSESNPDAGRLILSAIDNMLTRLDPHSSYVSPEEMLEMQRSFSGESFAGVGIRVDEHEDGVLVAGIIEFAAAEDAGLQEGDIITRIGATYTAGRTLDENVALMRGAEGSTVTLQILRDGQAMSFRVTRQMILHNATTRINLDGGIIYAGLSDFSAYNTADYFERSILRSIEEIGEENVRGLILDLRNNPGGLVLEAALIADLFLERGYSVITEEADGERLGYRLYPGDIMKGKPIVVLTNDMSASAAEILAGALQDHGRATILGTRTYGKGSVQSIMRLDNGGAVRVTSALYFTPDGYSIQGVGITPDIKFEMYPNDTPDNAPHGEAELEGTLANPNYTPSPYITGEVCRPEDPAATALPEGSPPELTELMNKIGTVDYHVMCAFEQFPPIAPAAVTVTVTLPHPG